MKQILLISLNQFGYEVGYPYYAKYLNEKFDVKYICRDKKLPKYNISNLEVLYIKTQSAILIYFKLIKYILKIKKENKIELVFCRNFALGFLVKLLFINKPVVYDIHTATISDNKFKKGFRDLILRINIAFFSYVTVLSESLRKELKISKKKAHILPLGGEFQYLKEKNKKRLNLLYVGSLSNRNIEETIEGLSLFLDQNEQFKELIRYIIIGHGDKSSIEKIHNTIDLHDLSKNVSYIGKLYHEKLIPFFESANIGISYIPQKKYYECQPPTKTFEYFLAGLAVIATNTYENRLVVNIKNGVIIEDNSLAFSLGLEKIALNLESYNFESIAKDSKKFSWRNIINSNLIPYIDSIIIANNKFH